MRYFALILAMSITASAGETRLEKIARVMTITKDADTKASCAVLLKDEVKREQSATKAEIAAIKREIAILNGEIVASR